MAKQEDDRRDQSEMQYRARDVLPNMEWLKKSRDDVPASTGKPLTENPFLKLESKPEVSNALSLTKSDENVNPQTDSSK